jgi:hypothetical protein
MNGTADDSAVPVSMAEFLQTAPPDIPRAITDLATYDPKTPTVNYRLTLPDIQLYCEASGCDGTRTFTTADTGSPMEVKRAIHAFLHYHCRNCRSRYKTFAIKAVLADPKQGTAIKFGEIPTFGPPVPSKVISLIGPDRDAFLNGRRSENHGLGIGAFAYYRRVVENQKGRIIEHMARVAERLGTTPEVLKQFSDAAKETQFTVAIDKIKTAIPSVLLIEGRNPLTLLHTALSEKLHVGSDAECLELAAEIRLVLTELADRISQALKDHAELTTAVNRLLNRGIAKKADSTGPK